MLAMPLALSLLFRLGRAGAKGQGVAWLSRKYRCERAKVLEMLTANCPFDTTGGVSGLKVVQVAADPTFAVDSRVNPDAVAGQVRIRFDPEQTSASCGGTEKLNTVPFVELPPAPVVP